MPTINIPGVGEIRLEQIAGAAVGLLSILALVLGLTFGMKDGNGSSNLGTEETTEPSISETATPEAPEPTPTKDTPTSAPTTTTPKPTPKPTPTKDPEPTEMPTLPSGPVETETTTPTTTMAPRPTLTEPTTPSEGPSRQEQLGLTKVRIGIKEQRFNTELVGRSIQNHSVRFAGGGLPAIAKQELEARDILDFSQAVKPNKDLAGVDMLAYQADEKTVVYFYRVDLGVGTEHKGNIFNPETGMGGDWLNNVRWDMRTAHDENYYYVAIATQLRPAPNPEAGKTAAEFSKALAADVLRKLGLTSLAGFIDKIPVKEIEG